ncbi:MAG: 3-hydroxyacyl-ACP dehydratase FabZ [Planctomycetes bacterium]|nr:3-hydroxyacyl-ACP dehydratase FabZ [Planctomycetota bacterium]
MTLERVTASIPHRPPFLWVDEVVEQTETTIRTTKRVAPEEPFFQGHYPDFPITPGVLVLEAIFQAGAILLSERARKAEGKVPVMTKIQDARFKTMVRPGDVLEVEVTLEDALEPLFHLSGKAKVGGKLAASTKFACALAPKPE